MHDTTAARGLCSPRKTGPLLWQAMQPRPCHAIIVRAIVIAVAVLAPMRTHAASPETPATLCQAAGTDDRVRPIPDSLVPGATRLFRLEAMPAEQVRHSSYFRCFGHHVLVCNLGANLPCGKANKARRLPAADHWCAENPNSGFIPMYVTGHDTVYDWSCRGSAAAIVKTRFTVDRRGFIAQFWKRVEAVK